jgi:hypothetical protein
MRPVSWNTLTSANAGDLQLERLDGSVERGPIKEIRQEGYHHIFETIWFARVVDGAGEWRRRDPLVLKIHPINFTLWANDDGYYFTVPNLGGVQIYRKHTKHLDPSNVNGLTNREVRESRAWIYDIPLDSDWKAIVDRVVSDLGADGVTSAYEQRQVQDEAAQFA